MVWLAIATTITCLFSIWLAVSAFRRLGMGYTLRRAVAAAGFACLGLFLVGLLVLLKLFHAFSDTTLIAVVTTRRLPAGQFEMTYIPTQGQDAVVRRFRLQGDQWSISGGVVKWHPLLTALGAPSYHKPMRVSGQWSDLEQQRTQFPTVYPLEAGADRFWEAFYWAQPHLPFVEAVYGSSAYVYVEPRSAHEISVSPTGYLIARARKDRR